MSVEESDFAREYLSICLNCNFSMDILYIHKKSLLELIFIHLSVIKLQLDMDHYYNTKTTFTLYTHIEKYPDSIETKC